MGQVTIILDDAAEAALRNAARAAGVSQNRWLADLIRRHFRGEEAPSETAPILIVDDDPICRELLLLQVEHLGWRADVAENGALALALLVERPYRLLLTDWRMPFMDGFQLTRAMREIERRQYGRLPIVAVTSELLGGREECCGKLHLDGYLRKPVNLEALAETLAIWLGRTPGTPLPSPRPAFEPMHPAQLPTG